MHIGKDIAQRAEQFNICQEWKGDLMTIKDKEKLIEMYLKGIDFCIANDFPPLDFIRDHFSGIIEQHGIYLDGDFEVVNPSKIVALGKSKGNVMVGGFKASQLYVRHASKVFVRAVDDCFVMVSVYDNASVEVEASNRAKVCLHNFNATVNYHTTGEARVKLVNKIS